MLDKNGNYPAIHGVSPKMEKSMAVYENLNVPVHFTGKMRLAKGFLPEFYVHMGFQKPTAYWTVLDLTFENGQLVKVEDCSKEMEAKRGKFKRQYEEGDISQRIMEAFSLDMGIE